MRETRVVNALLLEGLDDMLNLWWIEGRIALLYGKNSGDPGLLEPTLVGIKELLKAGYPIAGGLTKDPADGLLMVQPWDLSPDDATKRIEREWREIGNPEMGDVVWLELTGRGREKARELLEARCNPFVDDNQPE